MGYTTAEFRGKLDAKTENACARRRETDRDTLIKKRWEIEIKKKEECHKVAKKK